MFTKARAAAVLIGTTALMGAFVTPASAADGCSNYGRVIVTYTARGVAPIRMVHNTQSGYIAERDLGDGAVRSVELSGCTAAGARVRAPGPVSITIHSSIAGQVGFELKQAGDATSVVAADKLRSR